MMSCGKMGSESGFVIDAASEGIVKARAVLEPKLRKAGQAIIVAQTGLEAAIAV
jgi:hypothetical protein